MAEFFRQHPYAAYAAIAIVIAIIYYVTRAIELEAIGQRISDPDANGVDMIVKYTRSMMVLTRRQNRMETGRTNATDATATLKNGIVTVTFKGISNQPENVPASGTITYPHNVAGPFVIKTFDGKIAYESTIRKPV